MINSQKETQTKLTKGLLDLIILQILDTRPMHGYELITTIKKNLGVYLGASTIYPLLGSMEKRKQIVSDWSLDGERPRKVYKLTSDGKAVLQLTKGSLMLICKTIETIDRKNMSVDNVQIFRLERRSSENENLIVK